jgi:hypothetical protein
MRAFGGIYCNKNVRQKGEHGFVNTAKNPRNTRRK